VSTHFPAQVYSNWIKPVAGPGEGRKEKKGADRVGRPLRTLIFTVRGETARMEKGKGEGCKYDNPFQSLPFASVYFEGRSGALPRAHSLDLTLTGPLGEKKGGTLA